MASRKSTRTELHGPRRGQGDGKEAAKENDGEQPVSVREMKAVWCPGSRGKQVC